MRSRISYAARWVAAFVVALVVLSTKSTERVYAPTSRPGPPTLLRTDLPVRARLNYGARWVAALVAALVMPSPHGTTDG